MKIHTVLYFQSVFSNKRLFTMFQTRKNNHSKITPSFRKKQIHGHSGDLFPELSEKKTFMSDEPGDPGETSKWGHDNLFFQHHSRFCI